MEQEINLRVFLEVFKHKYKKQITDNIDLAIGDELVLFSAKTKLGKKEIQGIIAKEVYGEDTL